MTDVSRLTFTGNQKIIIDHVQKNLSDVGFVRTDMIDRSVAEGFTKWSNFRIINEVRDGSFPFKRSTSFTPEWPIGALKHVPNEAKRLVGQALMALNRDSPDPLLSAPAVQGSFQTWVTPMNYLDLLGMLESIKYYNPQERRCLHASDVYHAIRCPSGYVKHSEDSVFCPDCEAGSTCLCSPCSKLSDPELIMRALPLNSTWPGVVDTEEIKALSTFSESCKRMQLCLKGAVGQSVRWKILDQIGLKNRLRIEAPLIEKVEIRTSFEEAWQTMDSINYSFAGIHSQMYMVDIVASKAGTQVVEILINGKQAPMSPVIAHFVDAPLKVIKCAVGMQPQGDSGLCTNCTAGSAGVGGTNMCKACDPGSMQPLDGQAYCVACPIGRYAANAGASECTLCAAGKSTRGKAGNVQCGFCEPGQYAPSEGMERCKPCGRGTYSLRDGAIACDQCGGGQTTKDLGSANNASCGCDVGHYWARSPSGEHRCRSCPALGSYCPSFDSAPLVASGFYMEKDAPRDAWELNIWRCISVAACPGQRNLSDPVCFGDLEGTNCALCPEGMNKFGNACHECSTLGGVFLIPFLGLLSFLSFGLYHHFHERLFRSGTVKARHVLGPVVVGVALAYFQALGIYSRFGFYWPDLFIPLLDMSDIMLLNVEVVRVPCLMKVSLASAYLLPLALPLIAAVFIFAWLPCSRLASFLSNDKIGPFSYCGLLNSAGKAWQALYIAIVTITISLFDCYASPNGKTTIRAFPYATCEGSKYIALLPVAILGILVYVAGFFAVCLWLQHVAPLRFSDSTFRKATSFLFFKFSPRCWWYGVIIHSRSLLLATVTTVAPDYGYIQFMLAFLILLVAVICHVHFSPYLDSYSNFLEVCILSLLMITVMLGSWFSDERLVKEHDFLAHVLAGLLLAVSVGAIVIMLFAGVVAVLMAILPPDHLRQLKIARGEVRVEEIQALGCTLNHVACVDLVEMVQTSSSEDIRALRAVIDLVRLELDDVVVLSEKKRLPSRDKTFEKLTAASDNTPVASRVQVRSQSEPDVRHGMDEALSRRRGRARTISMFGWFRRPSAQVADLPSNFDSINHSPVAPESP
eukprot:TRINITY_DN16373_c0_g4_i2.p1 TRINITY_DN16373_c0_g4~~TRINITY_DN16373_c0_g4_i2.p1  ORF type:complete len:1263 (-),score=98.40 TRINITY_DN16373_c0_g4_i2:38-3295(-)